MKILYFSRDYTTHDHRFLSKLAETEHTIYYLRLERRGPQLEDRPLPPQIVMIPWRGGRQVAGLSDGLPLLLDLKRILRRLRPDLIHAGPVQRPAFLAALAGAPRLVSMSWGYDLLHDAHKNAAWGWATRFTLKRSAAFVGDCAAVRDRAVSYGMRPERIVTFPWGVDLQHFRPASSFGAPDSASSDHPFTLLSTRAWEPVYGVETLARAFAQIAPFHPRLRLALLGSGSQAAELRRILSKVETGAGGEPRVLFPGQIGYADLPRYYHSADLYISTSYSDGSSISLLEALACGRPALVADIPGNREWITPADNGWLFPPGDADALAAAILHSLENRDCLLAMGHAARRTAEARADWDKNFPLLLKAYAMARADR